MHKGCAFSLLFIVSSQAAQYSVVLPGLDHYAIGLRILLAESNAYVLTWETQSSLLVCLSVRTNDWGPLPSCNQFHMLLSLCNSGGFLLPMSCRRQH